MQGEIITIGDELLSGRVHDSNAQFIASRLSALGIIISAVSIVGDDLASIRDVLTRAAGRSEFAIVCGGLGPTDDDITAEAAALSFDRPLEVDAAMRDFIAESLKKRDRPWVDSYEKLATRPQGTEQLEPGGRTAGFHLFHEGVPFFFLPGIPSEVHHLIDTRVLPFLMEFDKDPSEVRQKIIKVYGIDEARICELLEGLDNHDLGVMIGYYPNFPENHVSITVRAKTAEQADKTIMELAAIVSGRVEPYIVATDSGNLENSLGELLTARGMTLAVAESCTGGLISHRLTSVSGSSNYFERGCVVYSNNSKSEMLGVPADIINTHGAVSSETAEKMAQGIRKVSGTDLGLATTGIAGPTGGTKEKPVGTVFIGLAGAESTLVERFHFAGDRQQVKILTAQTALSMALNFLKE